MSQYYLERLFELEGNQRIFKLYEEGKCEFNEFWKRIESEGNLVNELAVIFRRLEDISCGRRLPKEKYRKLQLSLSWDAYEIKTKHLRVYLIKNPLDGQILIAGGKKTNQKKDIKRFERIAKRYLSFLEETD